MALELRFTKPLFRRKLFFSTSPYVMTKGREEGESELTALAQKTGHREGAWLYVPEEQSWLNVSTTTGELENDLVSGAYVRFPAVDFDQWGACTLYHTHPEDVRQNLKKTIADACKKQYSMEEGELMLLISDYIDLYTALPSVVDVQVASKILADTKRCNLDFRVVSSVGISRITIQSRDQEQVVAAYTAVQEHLADFTIKSPTGTTLDSYVSRINSELEGLAQLDIRPNASVSRNPQG